ncbi:hypothetical protein IFU40_14380 [Microbacterium sp. CFBP 13617]|uniref:hypothetical protein n=1 Tax=Microbacterium sp. CFBP 13617 TaxID=2774035 RepID=UPI001780F0DA|nr:hypothetical protein [Microbacterium sp. CFBP 13617]MBD8219820.1 hypothetical protein [Microbacterium sp. CFBP 13617]
MLSVLRLVALSVATTFTLVVGLAVPTDVAHAETPPTGGVAWRADDPALPANDEASEEPQMPEGSFDVPSDVRVEPAPPVEPIGPPPIGDAVATWQGDSLAPADLKALLESVTSTSKSSPSSGGIAGVTTQPPRTGEGDGAYSVTKTYVKRVPFVRQVGGFVRGGCVASGVPAKAGQLRSRACCPDVRRSSCVTTRGNLRVAMTTMLVD